MAFCHSSLHGLTCDKMEKYAMLMKTSFLCEYMCGCVCMCAYMWNVENHLKCCLQKYCPPPVRWVFYVPGTHQLGCIVQAVNPKEPFVFCLFGAGILNIRHHSQLFL